jgi:hypothetical protein
VPEQTPEKARPPFWERRSTRAVLIALLVVGALGAVATGWLMRPLNSALASAHAGWAVSVVPGWPIAVPFSEDSPITPHGIFDWELAFTAARAENIVSAWNSQANKNGGIPRRLTEKDDTLMALAEESLRLDLPLIGSYFLALTALCLLVVVAFPRQRRRIWYQVTLLPTLAALFDLAENRLLVRQLGGAFDGALWASLAASAKFTLLAATMIALVIVGFAWLGKRPRKPRTRKASPLATVVAAEQRYLDQRRVRARVPAQEHPVGLAMSGGGIRSATINLGVLQALARHRVLPVFDYLSTVSGGGYIGAALSSLLSINDSRVATSPLGKEGQYFFDRDGNKEDEARFSTEHERFPFNERYRKEGRQAGRGLDGGAQMRHLRAAGEFLVGRRDLFSVEMLRVIGSVLVGILFHVVHFGLLLVAVAAAYLWGVYLMVGQRATRAAEGVQEYGQFVRDAFGFTVEWNWGHPFLTAAIAGLVTTTITLYLARELLTRLPDGWFERPGLTLERRRILAAVLAMLLSMFVVGFSLAAWVRFGMPDNLLNISIPGVSYLGGGVCLAVLHGWIKARRGSDRKQRSRLAAQEGAFVLWIALSLFLVLFMLPFLVFFGTVVGYLSEWPLGSLLGWLLTLFGARMFAEGEPESGARGAVGKFLSRFPELRKVLLSLVVFAAVLGGGLLICVQIWRLEPETEPGTFRITVSLVAAALYLLTSWLNFNRLSLSFFYRDRLAEAYLRTTEPDPENANFLRPLRNNEPLRLKYLHGRRPARGPEECVTSAPYHLVVTCLNLGADQRPKQANRKTDQFIFSRLYCGSETTGFLETKTYRDGATQLADAMTISGAAASPAMGKRTFFAQSVAMTLFNVRLGRWMENPAWVEGTSVSGTFWPPYLRREIGASCDAEHRLVYLSDGGHSGDNLGIYPLLMRRCRLILAIDAEHDPTGSGNSLVEALRQIRIDEGITVDIDLSPLRPGPEGKPSAAHFVSGRIDYPLKKAVPDPAAKLPPGTGDLPASTGWLIVIKSSLTGDEPEMIANYQRGNEPFPHQTTADLFFDDAQFEAYRELGEHMVETLLDTSPVCRSELKAVAAPPRPRSPDPDPDPDPPGPA